MKNPGETTALACQSTPSPARVSALWFNLLAASGEVRGLVRMMLYEHEFVSWAGLNDNRCSKRHQVSKTSFLQLEWLQGELSVSLSLCLHLLLAHHRLAT